MQVPAKVKDALAGTTTLMLASLNIPQSTLDAASAVFWAEIEGHGVRALTDQRPLDRILSREQVKEILGRSKKTISLMCINGTLHGVYGGKDKKRLTGISEKSVRDFIEGK